MKKTCEAPGCGKDFEAVRSTARFCCTSCRVKASREGKQAEAAPAADCDEVMGGLGYTTPAAGVSAPSKPKYRFERQANCHGKQEARRIAAGDVNALARNVILSRVPTKKTEEDSIDARVKRLEQAMKQFASKKKPTKDQS